MSNSSCSSNSVSTAIYPEIEFSESVMPSNFSNKSIQKSRQNWKNLADKRKKKKEKKKVKENLAKTSEFNFSTSFQFLLEKDLEILANMLKELILMLQHEQIKRSENFDLLFFLIVQRISAAVKQIQIQVQEKIQTNLNNFSELFVNLTEIGTILYQKKIETFVLPKFNSRISKKDKIFVPKHPNYNFIGRILGPRGISVRQLEFATDCKILIRGKGSVKNEKYEEILRYKKIPGFEHLKEPLHVLIIAEGLTEFEVDQKLENCRHQIKTLFKPEFDDYKRRQLAQLAIINGNYIQQKR